MTLATTGAEARAALRTPDFELFLVDWMLPDASGLDLVRTIRDNAKYSEAAILMISSRTDRDDIVTAIRSGIDAYVAKPFKAEELRGRIDEVWQRRSRNRGQAQQIELILGKQERLHESRVNPPVESRSNPLVILGEGSVTAGALARGTNTRILEYLATATTAIAAANAFMPRLRLGYYLAATTGEVTQLIKDRQTRERVQLAMISTDCYGNCVLMARLLHMRNPGSGRICIVLDQPTDLSPGERLELESYEALVIDRPELDANRWRDIIEGQIISHWSEAMHEEYIAGSLTQEEKDTIADLEKLL